MFGPPGDELNEVGCGSFKVKKSGKVPFGSTLGGNKIPLLDSRCIYEVAVALLPPLIMFQEVNGRLPDGVRDKFEGTLDGLVTVSPKLQQRLIELRGRADAMRLEAISSNKREAMLRSLASAASAPFLMGIPSPTN